jgi:hypothetical protein
MEQRATAGLDDQVTFINADATDYATYRNILPCDIVLVCGVLGHVRPDERGTFVQKLAAFCNSEATLIWTRRVDKGESRFTQFRQLFERSSFERVRETITPDDKWGVATHRYVGPPCELPKTGRIFRFERNAGRA